jgi:penicillin amidase
VDYFFEAPATVSVHRMETIEVFGGESITIPVWRSANGPIIEPMPWDPTTDPEPTAMFSWAYAHWGREAKSLESFLKMATAESIADFDEGIEGVAVSQHFTYADRDGNIAYWMSGWDPIRALGVDPRFPQIGDGTQEWTGERRPRAHDSNTPQGYYGGWNNKASVDYNSPPNSLWYNLGRWHRAHVIDEYLSTHDNLTYEEIRDLALNIATTSSFMGGGNTWTFVADAFRAAVAANSSPDRDAAVDMIDAWDGHFVAGGPAEWRMGTGRADPWVLQDAWVREVLRLTLEDEFMMAGLDWTDQPLNLSYNVLLHALDGPAASLPTLYNWFQDKSGSGKPTTAEGIIVQALDNAIANLGGLGPYNVPRGNIYFGHSLLGNLNPEFNQIHSIPYSERSTFAHVVEYGENGPTRIESMWPLGPSGQLWFTGFVDPTFDLPYNFTMAPAFDPFMPRAFSLFD